MGKIKNNVVTRGFSGKFGDDLVFRQVDNQTVFAKRTLVTGVPTQRQVEIRNKFTEAANFASAAIENEEAKLMYDLMADIQGLKSAYIAAMTDYLTEPEIGGVYTAAYKGQVGDAINIRPRVPYKVVSIEVRIVAANGNNIEAGAATVNGLKWKYIATVANASVRGSQLILVARDRQGKETTFEQLL